MNYGYPTLDAQINRLHPTHHTYRIPRILLALCHSSLSEIIVAHKLVVHCKRVAYDVYIGRPSIWGNPFVIGKDGTREQVIEQYREYVLGNKFLMARIGDLKGKTLGCWCAPLACHGDVLAELSNSR